jgi:hypothetical protein
MEKKIEVYSDTMGLFMAFVNPATLRGMTPKRQESLGLEMADIGARLSLFGSAEVVKKYVNFRLEAQGGSAPEKIIDCFAEVVLAMRAGLVGADDITADHVMGTFLVLSDKMEDYQTKGAQK